MAQFIRTPIHNFHEVFQTLIQVSQVSYHDERVITIDWDPITHRVVISDLDIWFYLTSPDIDNLTMRQVLEGLGYGNEQMIVTWVADDEVDAVLGYQVAYAILNQITLYRPNQPIPEVHNQDPFPMLPNSNEEPLDDPNEEPLQLSDSEDESN